MDARKIIHIDMDAFYASIEQRDDPALRGRPVVVGGRPEGRGVVAAASYEARRFGIHSAMPAVQARRACPQAVFVRPRMAHYREVSRTLRAIFREVTELVEPLSLDEAYLDVTENRLGEPLAGRLARGLKQEIRRRLSLTASAGVGPSKLVAKIASDLDKPDGLRIVPPEQVLAFLAPLPVERLWGVGPATAKRLRELGLRTIADVRATDPAALAQRFGKHGGFLARLSRGDDPRVVSPRRKAKSRGTETTFGEDLREVPRMLEVLLGQVESLAETLSGMSARARTITLKVRYADFTTVTRSRTFAEPGRDAEALFEAVHDLLLHHTEAAQVPVRLLGVAASGLVADGDPTQLSLPFEGGFTERP